MYNVLFATMDKCLFLEILL